MDGRLASAAHIFDADGARAVEQDAARERADHDAEIATLERGPEIADRGAAAPAVTHRHLPAAETLLARAVVVGGRRMARRGARGREGVDQRIGETRGAHRERAVAAAEIAGAAFPRFLPAEIGQHMRIGPFRQAGGRPAVVVAAVAPHIGHGVDRGRTAHHLAARAFDAASAHAVLGLAEIHPVMHAVEQEAWPAERNMDPGVAVPAAGLEQQNLAVAVLREAIRQRAAGGAGADDDVVVGFYVGHELDRFTYRYS